jgi:hypothetical protein
MIRFLHLGLLFLFITPLVANASDRVTAPAAYRITGVVVSGVDEAPIAHAHLNAAVAMRDRPSRFSGSGFGAGISGDADEHGRFALTLPSAGAWRLTASAAGFVSQAYEEHDNYSSAVVLSTSEPSHDLRFRLSPEAEITGTVLDEAGEAVRGALVTLQYRGADSPNQGEQPFRNRMNTPTDDRGVFEFVGLAAGDYRVLVDAKPWYSSANQQRLQNGSSTSDPALDVTYQLTWFPGVDDSSEAEVLSLRPADTRRADFHLVPIPAVHLQLTLPPQQESASGRSLPFFPVLERIDNGGNGPGVTQSMLGRNRSGGQLDIGGLAPGVYRMRLPGQDRAAPATVIKIASGSSRVVDAAAVSTEVAHIALDFNDPGERQVGVELTNTENGQRFTSFQANMFLLARNREASQQTPRNISLDVPPGRYEVSLAGRGDAYLIGIAARGAEVSGRFIIVHAGESTLTLRTGKGHAAVNGTASANGKPVVGAMVLLVPAGLEDPYSFTRLVRDQTNTDGSFDLNNIIPGQYILIAVDHGWKSNWKDGSTLQRYLTQGIPFDLRADMKITQEISAQQP